MPEKWERLVAALADDDGWVTASRLADRLGVSDRTVRTYAAQANRGGEHVVESGPDGYRLDRGAWARRLEAGPAAHGWAEDQVWTGARVKALIGRAFHVAYSVSGATRLMRRLGFHPPAPGTPGGRTRRGSDPRLASRDVAADQGSQGGGRGLDLL